MLTGMGFQTSDFLQSHSTRNGTKVQMSDLGMEASQTNKMVDFEVAVEARKKTMTVDFAMLATQGAYKDDFVFAVESSLMA